MQELLETMLIEREIPKLRPLTLVNIRDDDDVENY